LESHPISNPQLTNLHPRLKFCQGKSRHGGIFLFLEEKTAVKVSSKKIIAAKDEGKAIAALAKLTYATEKQMCVVRHRHGKGFYYTKHGKKITGKKQLQRFKDLVIPPAWEEVRICLSEKGHLQATGKDTKNRKVYLYHPLWVELQNQTKFFRMADFGKTLPKIRKQVEKDLKLRGMPQRKVLALIIRLMEETHIRIGNPEYATENESFGLTTFRSRHVEFSKNKLTFEFKGKKGKEQRVDLTDKKLVKLVNRCEEIPGWEVFKYYDEKKEKQSIDSGMVNDYIRKAAGEDFSAKDFRTWAGTKLFFEHLMELGPAENKTLNRKNIIEAVEETAEALGNTKSVCENYYIHPEIILQYETGELAQQFEKVSKTRDNKYFSKTEKVLLGVFEGYKVKLGEENN
jgi:DNA topoisomerase-1